MYIKVQKHSNMHYMMLFTILKYITTKLIMCMYDFLLIELRRMNKILQAKFNMCSRINLQSGT